MKEAPDELRCRRSDGKTWRCHGWRIHEKPYCEKHYLQIVGNSLKRKSSGPSRNSRVGKKRSENSKASGGGGGGGKGGGFVVNKSKKLGLFGGGKRGKRSRGRDGEAVSSEEVLPKKKPRSKRMSVEDDKDETDSEETEEDERMDVVKITGDRSDEKGAKIERHGGNAVKSGKRGGKIESVMKKKKAVRKEESNDERGNVVKGAKGSGKKILLDEKKKRILRDEGSDEEEEGRNAVKSSKRGGKIELGRKDKKQTERNEEESEDEEYWFKELSSATKSGVKSGNEKKKFVRNYQSDDEEEGRRKVVKSGKRSGEVEEEKRKDSDSSETSDEDEGQRYKVEKIDKRYRELELGKKKKKKKKVLSSEEETEEEEEISRELFSAKSSGGDNWGKKKRKIERNDLIIDKGGKDSTGKGGQVELRTKMKNDRRAVPDEKKEEDGDNLKEINGKSLVKMSKTKGLRTKMVETGMKDIQNEEDFATGGFKDAMKDVKDDGGKKKSELRGNNKEVEGDSEDGDDVDGSKENKGGKGEVVGHHSDGDNVNGSEEIDDACLLKFAKKDIKPEALSKRGDKKLQKKKVELPNMLKGENEERSSEEDNVGENVDSVFRAIKKAKKTLKTDSQNNKNGRKDPKTENVGAIEEEDDDRTESDDGAYIFRERSSRSKDNGKLKVDLRRKHFSTDVSCVLCSLYCVFVKERNL